MLSPERGMLAVGMPSSRVLAETGRLGGTEEVLLCCLVRSL